MHRFMNNFHIHVCLYIYHYYTYSGVQLSAKGLTVGKEERLKYKEQDKWSTVVEDAVEWGEEKVRHVTFSFYFHVPCHELKYYYCKCQEYRF